MQVEAGEAHKRAAQLKAHLSHARKDVGEQLEAMSEQHRAALRRSEAKVADAEGKLLAADGEAQRLRDEVTELQASKAGMCAKLEDLQSIVDDLTWHRPQH
jgi:chromosome segregation ATPase